METPQGYDNPILEDSEVKLDSSEPNQNLQNSTFQKNNNQNIPQNTQPIQNGTFEFNIFLILSMISWLILIILIWQNFSNMMSKGNVMFFTIKPRNAHNNDYWPLQMSVFWYYLIQLIMFVLSTLTLVIYVIKIIYKKDVKLYLALLGDQTKFHFVPLFLIDFIYIFGNVMSLGQIEEIILERTAMAFDIASLICFIIIYYKMKIDPSDYLCLVIKKGFFSILITLCWYYFFYNITDLALYVDIKSEYPYYDSNSYYDSSYNDYYSYYYKDDIAIKKRCSLAFAILFGIGSEFFSIFLKDIVIALLSCIMNIGCAIYIFTISKIKRDATYNGPAEGIIYIVHCAALLTIICVLFVKKRKELIE